MQSESLRLALFFSFHGFPSSHLWESGHADVDIDTVLRPVVVIS